MPKIVADETIFNAAMQTVFERGYTGATTKQIAEAANISEVTLFRKYGNKAELIRQAITAVTKQIDFESATQYTGNVVADLLRVTQMYQGAADKNGQFIYTIILEIHRNPDLIEVIDEPMGMFDAIGQLLARYQAEGTLKQEQPLSAVAGLLGPLMATNMIRGAAPGLPLPPIDLAHHVACFLNGRCTQPINT